MTDPIHTQAQSQLILQGNNIVTIPINQVPVLQETSFEDSCATAVNFLRCGCPAVQVIAVGEVLSDVKNYQLGLQRILHALQLPRERLESCLNKAPPFVMTITRRME